jgi:hypothetical protein
MEQSPQEILSGDESVGHPSNARAFPIVVNGRRKVVHGQSISFEEVVAVAFDPVPSGPNYVFTVSYRNGPPANPDGNLLDGQSVCIKEGMVFNATVTDKS